MKIESFARHLKGKTFQTQLHRARRQSLARILAEEGSLAAQRKSPKIVRKIRTG